MLKLSVVLLLLFSASCGRYFHTDLRPTPAQEEGMSVEDDGSVTYALDRLTVNLKPMTDAELNRLAATNANLELNPYTFGEWKKAGDGHTPPRFTVFRLKVNNYQYPKVRIDPGLAHISTANNREYGALSFGQLYSYYRAYWLGRTGRGRQDFQTRTDVLKRTLYTGAMVFSGNEEQGFIVFPVLDDDVSEIRVHIKDIALRFNFADEPAETVDLDFSFKRDILRGYTPDTAARLN